jgi:hypothetical protein
MDVHCTTCGEPWDVYHLRHDAIFETDLTPEESKAWITLSANRRLAAGYREKFKASGWEFGESIMNVIRCPSCPPGAKPDPQRLATKQELEQLLDGDEDGLAARFEDHLL